MPKYTGKNDIKSTKTLIQERARYKLKAFPENSGRGDHQIVDFNFVEKNLYGRVDTNGDPVILKEENLKNSNFSYDPESGMAMLDFVADMFRDMQRTFVNACRLGKIPQDDP